MSAHDFDNTQPDLPVTQDNPQNKQEDEPIPAAQRRQLTLEIHLGDEKSLVVTTKVRENG
ncbi:hypothetical protein EYF80_042790 [Liparis tanakae]|uniref:Uncharacterized protein n=1 Tax=Liparis tanakae TaxID=230148 RepID=A0A4Z2G0H3_9TELE|nr:hypothetical protein EYF80_042790 [Liparis tanakae]